MKGKEGKVEKCCSSQFFRLDNTLPDTHTPTLYSTVPKVVGHDKGQGEGEGCNMISRIALLPWSKGLFETHSLQCWSLGDVGNPNVGLPSHRLSLK